MARTGYSEDTRQIIGKGREVYKDGKSLAKATAKAASGNVVGAVAEVVKNPHLARNIFIVAFCVIFLCAYMLMALPLSVFESVGDYVAETIDEWETGVYSSTDDFLLAALTQTVKTTVSVVGDIVGLVMHPLDTIGKIKDRMKGVVSSNTELSDADKAVSDSSYFVMGYKEALADELNTKVLAVESKLNTRREEIRGAIQGNIKPLHDQLRAYASAHYKGFNEIKTHVYIGTNTQITTEEALRILSLHTVQFDSNPDEARIGNFNKYLGYNKEGMSKEHFKVSNFDADFSVPKWAGSFMPQYLIEQRQKEKEVFGKVVTDYSKYSCALSDLAIVVSAPTIENCDYHKETETRFVGYDDKGNPKYKTVIVLVATLNIDINIRDTIDLCEIATLWKGDLAGDGQTSNVRAGRVSVLRNQEGNFVSKSWMKSPVNCKIAITCPFGDTKFHTDHIHAGIDIGIREGDRNSQPAICVAEGEVIVSAWNNTRGNYVVVDHKNGYCTLYQHLKCRNVGVGDKVDENSQMGIIGNTGHSTGTHLHFEIRKGHWKTGEAIDPAKFFTITD